ncbi:diaminopropionate ammonia-lyase [Solicola gregarius]|uniref:Diaminopropionate ammonia-lyase n=1 Tax=Solicola gregarius TaxID=2908642 RepID=A0AA46TL36_9ACTN|nr:diaminopropionate ammonia-lyase [Solicola gregarius]UYM06413.1 diaminopropionate ammonia-lyase [Solicola gregarius]
MAIPAWYCRPAARRWTCPPVSGDPTAFHRGLDGYAPTPLVAVPHIAEQLGVGRAYVKDESTRLGLPAFKVLGASWAIHRALEESPGEVTTLVTATDGNHGHAVARTARLLGLNAEVFVPRGVEPVVVAAIGGEGADVTVLDAAYDDAVATAAHAAERTGGLLIQDTAWPGYERVPGWIVDGYTTLLDEIDAQLADAMLGGPDLVAVPVGVGSLAQAVVRHYRRGGRAPAVLSVEPTAAPCTIASLDAGEPVTVPTGTTSMAGLNCGTLSSLAWPVLRDGLDAAVTVTDDDTASAIEQLAAADIAAGPSGAASLAGTTSALAKPSRRDDLGVDDGSTVVVLSTEGPLAGRSGK